MGWPRPKHIYFKISSTEVSRIYTLVNVYKNAELIFIFPKHTRKPNPNQLISVELSEPFS